MKLPSPNKSPVETKSFINLERKTLKIPSLKRKSVENTDESRTIKLNNSSDSSEDSNKKIKVI